MKNRLLLINPPIHDFSAFNLWARPLGILKIANILLNLDIDIDFIDCLSLDYEKLVLDSDNNYIKSKIKKYSTYHYFKKELPKPDIYKNIKRKYYRFGIGPEILKKILSNIPKPNAVLITSIMTYWYPGVFETIKVIKEIYPDTYIILGGIYASLCYNHAKIFSKADYIFQNYDTTKIINLIGYLINDSSLLKKYKLKFSLKNNEKYNYTSFDYYKNNDFIPILTSYGCIYKCKYCASNYLSKSFNERSYLDIYNEINHNIRKYNVKDIAFYDDALLFNKDKRILPLLNMIINNNIKVNFHTPNGIHLKYIDEITALLMKESGFKTLRFGFESSIKYFQKDSGNKINNKEFEKAIQILFDIGFTSREIGIYILIGLPNQTKNDLISTIKFVKSFGLNPRLCEYSPIPHTRYFNRIQNQTNIDILNEPLYHNNSTLHLWSNIFTEDSLNELKFLAKE